MAKKGKETVEKDAATAVAEAAPPPRLIEKYWNEIRPELKKRFHYENELAVPKLIKIVVNMGVGKAIENKNRITHATRDLEAVTGQKAVVANAKKSVAGFKLREGMPIGAMVTLRREKMYEFFDRVVSIVIPRIRDFRGLTKKMDGRGNYSFGISEQSVFSEVNLDKLEFVQGMQITVVTSAKTDEEGMALLELFGFPFRK